MTSAHSITEDVLISVSSRHHGPSAPAIKAIVFWPTDGRVKMLMNVKMTMDVVNSFVSTHSDPISVLVKLALGWKMTGKGVDKSMIFRN